MTTLLAIGVILLQVFVVAVVFLAITNKALLSGFSKWTLVLLRIVLTGAVLGSLFFSEVKGFEPCLLCWWQRVFIFGAAILSWTGDIRKSALLRMQIIVFSLFGIAIALVHNIIDIFPTGLDICGSSGVSCLKRYIDLFGYITIPMMSLTVLATALVLVLVAKGNKPAYPQDSIAE